MVNLLQIPIKWNRNFSLFPIKFLNLFENRKENLLRIWITAFLLPATDCSLTSLSACMNLSKKQQCWPAFQTSSKGIPHDALKRYLAQVPKWCPSHPVIHIDDSDVVKPDNYKFESLEGVQDGSESTATPFLCFIFCFTISNNSIAFCIIYTSIRLNINSSTLPNVIINITITCSANINFILFL